MLYLNMYNSFYEDNVNNSCFETEKVVESYRGQSEIIVHKSNIFEG